jgi:hypothetical protein
VLYLSLPIERGADAKAALTPYLDALLTCYSDDAKPARGFEVFYTQHTLGDASSPNYDRAPLTDRRTIFRTPRLPTSLAVTPDAAVAAAERLFFDIARTLRDMHPEWREDEGEGERGAKELEEGGAKVEVGEMERGAGADIFGELKFWPPLEQQQDDDDAW